MDFEINTCLLFLDDTYGKNTTEIASLTGLRVPVEKVEIVRLAFAEMLLNRLNLKRNGCIETHLPPLHGKELLKNQPGVDDQLRLAIFQDIVNIVLDAKLSIHRDGIYVSDELHQLYKDPTERFAYQFAWFRIIETLGPLLKSNYIIPVMDRTDDEVRMRHLSDLVRQGVLMRAQRHGDMYSLKGGEHILSEVLFADHRHSFLTQIVDVCSYLRHACDRSRIGAVSTEFRRRIVEIGMTLEPAIAYESVSVIYFNNAPTGPESINHFFYNDQLLDPSCH